LKLNPKVLDLKFRQTQITMLTLHEDKFEQHRKTL